MQYFLLMLNLIINPANYCDNTSGQCHGVTVSCHYTCYIIIMWSLQVYIIVLEMSYLMLNSCSCRETPEVNIDF